MPKEIIVEAFGYIPEDAEQQGLVEVSWQRSLEHVQLVTYARHPETKETSVLSGPRYVTLDRAGINELIRKLRKARDQAFGRDE